MRYQGFNSIDEAILSIINKEKSYYKRQFLRQCLNSLYKKKPKYFWNYLFKINPPLNHSLLNKEFIDRARELNFKHEFILPFFYECCSNLFTKQVCTYIKRTPFDFLPFYCDKKFE